MISWSVTNKQVQKRKSIPGFRQAILSIVLAMWSLGTTAQITPFCSTVGTENAIGQMTGFSAPCIDHPGPFFFKVYAHILRTENETGGQSFENVESALSHLYTIFSPHNIYLIWDCERISYIDDDEFFSVAIENSCALWDEYNHSDGIDIYFDDPNSSSPGGIAMDIGSDAFIVGGTWTYNSPSIDVALSDIVIHEMGHCFGLWHTHHGTVPEGGENCNEVDFEAGEAENITRDDEDPQFNCDEAGDYCCGTPADPGINFDVDSECDLEFNPSPYNPDQYNFMAYTSPHCMTWFSLDQSARMRCFAFNTIALYNASIKYESELEITSNVTWSTTALPHDGNFVIFDALTIKSGYTLTIGSGVTIRFHEGASLIIEPNAQLHLYGKLTSSNCKYSWEGVKVYGDPNEDQYYDFGASAYHQGILRGYPGSVIEYAITAVEAFGPDEDDTGGIVRCNGTTFRDHVNGVVIKPYANLVGTIPHHYHGTFQNCVFEITDSYIHDTKFIAHLDLTGVIGVSAHGCDFSNSIVPDGATVLTDFGYGILAKGAGFSVGAISPDYPDECTSPCDRSSFTGLGYGVMVNSGDFRNRAFHVNHSDFSECYVGIGVDGVSAGQMIYNRFYMGEIPDVAVMDGDQIGINLRKWMHGFDLQENEFESSDVNTNHTMGIVSDFLGNTNNFIRRNIFSNMTLSNEAFGENGTTGDFVSGLIISVMKISARMIKIFIFQMKQHLDMRRTT